MNIIILIICRSKLLCTQRCIQVCILFTATTWAGICSSMEGYMQNIFAPWDYRFKYISESSPSTQQHGSKRHKVFAHGWFDSGLWKDFCCTSSGDISPDCVWIWIRGLPVPAHFCNNQAATTFTASPAISAGPVIPDLIGDFLFISGSVADLAEEKPDEKQ